MMIQQRRPGSHPSGWSESILHTVDRWCLDGPPTRYLDQRQMPTTIDFRSIRPWDGSQREGFEELCCQLAALEQVPNTHAFIKKRGAGGDAGVEAYRVLTNGDEHALQAKYFIDEFGGSQWQQLDESVQQALEKHPRMVKYTICLPRDLDDARRDVPDSARTSKRRQVSKRALWDQTVERWAATASARGMTVTFELWGKFELAQRLQRPEAQYVGKLAYWFDQVALTPEWFSQQLSEAQAAAGPRYTAAFNVVVPEAQLFEGLGRTAAFLQRLPAWYSRIARAWKSDYLLSQRPAQAVLYLALQETVRLLLAELKTAAPLPGQPLNIGGLKALVDCAATALRSVIEAEDDQSTSLPGARPPHNDVLYELRRFGDHLRDLRNALTQPEYEAVNASALLLTGEAGTGKTHLFCDVARHRLERGLPTVLLMGQRFSTGEPKRQILEQLDLSHYSWEQFVGALDAAGQASGQRALIMIDALNEGAGSSLWRSHLSAFLSTARRFPHVAVAVSCRSTYGRVTIPPGLPRDDLLPVEHHGFAGQEDVATASFFEHYGIQAPTVPLLTAEFSNPLFLKVFCQGLQQRGVARLPSGAQGATQIFRQFLDTVNEELSRPDRVDFDPKQRLVHQAVQTVAGVMARQRQPWLSRDEAAQLVDALAPGRLFQRSLFADLIAEGVLAEDLQYHMGKHQDVIRFPFEKFTDHFVVSALLELEIDPASPQAAFEPEGPLAFLVTPGWQVREYAGWLEALAIHLPERYGLEVLDLLPKSITRYDRDLFEEVFCASLPWRSADSVTETTAELLRDLMCRIDSSALSYSALLLTATNPDQPLNAHWLDQWLKTMPLAARDATWTLYINGRREEAREVTRLINWAWHGRKDGIADEAVYLAGIALTWCLSASNRIVRDRATKALIMLLRGRIAVLRRLLIQFESVNDPYVAERLAAVAYGVAMGEQDPLALRALAQTVYDQYFAGEGPPAHILLRDYARGVLEVAAHRRALPVDVNLASASPPFPNATTWPLHAPTDASITAYRPDDEPRLRRWKRPRYIGLSTRELRVPNTNVRGIVGVWPAKVTAKVWSEDGFNMRSTLSPAQSKQSRRDVVDDQSRALWSLYSSAYSSGDFARYQIDSGIFKFGTWRTDRAVDHEDFQRFDNQLARRWVLQRVFELGWRSDWFGEADTELAFADQGRMTHQHERIGKKYQWIALHQLLAHLSDHLGFQDESWTEVRAPYVGPWQLMVRDIDPSVVVEQIPEAQHGLATWWQPHEVTFAELNFMGQQRWLQTDEDHPELPRLVEVIDPAGEAWLNLQGMFTWTEPALPEYEQFALPQRELWVHLHAFVVPSRDGARWTRSLKDRSLSGGWLPSPADYYSAYLGEYPWAPAYHEHDYSWQEPRGLEATEAEGRTLGMTAVRYAADDSGYDQSVRERFSLNLPSQLLLEGMGLHWAGAGARFVDDQGLLVAFDPAADMAGPAALLVRKSSFLAFLERSKLQVIWTLAGEKRLIGGNMTTWSGRHEFSALYRWEGRLTLKGRYDKFIGPPTTGEE
jgi:hypothetical protein